MNLKPMLAASKPRTMSDYDFWKLAEKHLPLLVQEKLDGIRCIIGNNSIPLTRQLNPIPNTWIRTELAGLMLPIGLDGEILTYNKDGQLDNFNTISSNVMSIRGTPNFKYIIFDTMFGVRALLWDFLSMDYLEYIDTTEEHSIEDIKTKLTNIILAGGEGIMLRKPHSPYKHGRSTLKEFLLVKVKPTEIAEAIIVGFKELMRYSDEGTVSLTGALVHSKRKSNLMAGNTLGALIVKSFRWNATFEIGTGFTSVQRHFIWNNKQMHEGKRVMFKYQQNRSKKDRPISPVFERIVI